LARQNRAFERIQVVRATVWLDSTSGAVQRQLGEHPSRPPDDIGTGGATLAHFTSTPGPGGHVPDVGIATVVRRSTSRDDASEYGEWVKNR
jgi:hypothetical protein